MAEFLQQCGSWGVLATLAAYAAGVWVNRKTGKALFNPLLMGSIFMIVFLSCFGVPYADYKSSAQPVSWLLMPATVSLAIPLYEKWELLEKNLAAIFASIAAGVPGPYKAAAQKYPVFVCTSWLSSPIETPSASSTRRISSGGMTPARSRRRRLSSVRICSVKMMLSLASPQRSARTLMCVGRRFLSWRLVMAAAMTVGLCRFPISF